MELLWREKAGEATIYRVYGTSPVVEIPKVLEGCPVTGIGAYCFSDRQRMSEDGLHRTRSDEMTESHTSSVSHMTELAGGFIEKVILPDTLRQIGNAAFFNCRQLRKIELGGGSLTIGSDVFNNCTKLKKAVVRGKASDSTGVKQLVTRISWDLEVSFQDAILLYPEYYETYDTIAPAHIFGLNIQGEGFRARQCFRGEAVDLAAYDEIFGKAQAEESVETLACMALNRLMTPVELTEERQQVYEGYVKHQEKAIVTVLVKKRQLEQLEFVCRHKYVEGTTLDIATTQAIDQNWSEGAMQLLAWKKKYYAVDKKKRYEF